MLIKLSVIIPTFNRKNSLEKCLDALVRQTFDSSFWEVIVVNDGGVDLEDLLSGYKQRLNCSYLVQQNKGPASARNAGVQKSIGEIIAFLDDDCLPDATWVETILQSSKPQVIVGGKVQNIYASNMYSEASQVLIDFLYDYNDGRKDAFFTSNNFCVQRKDFMRLNGFRTSFQTSAGEDREFCVRAANAGLKLIYIPSMKIAHAHFLNLVSFCRLHKKYGFAAFNFQKEMQAQGIILENVPKLSFYIKMLKYPFGQSQYKFYQKVQLAFLLGFSQFFVAIGFYQNRLKR